MTTPGLWTLIFAATAVLTAPLAGRLLWRRHSLLAATALALVATAGVVMAWKLQAVVTPPAFALSSGAPGQFQTIPAGALDQALLAARGRPVLLEFYADWCSSCQVWKRQVFNRSDVQATLQPYVLLRIDATEMSPEAQTALNRYELVGLPAIISFDTRGRELASLRLLGEMTAPAFMDWVHLRLHPATGM